jgi:beta-lactamase class A
VSIKRVASGVLVLTLALLCGCSDVGTATIDGSGKVSASNDKPFPVLSAAKIIPAAMAIERRQYLDLAELAVVKSDNAATDELVTKLGGVAAVSQWLAGKHLPTAFATEHDMVADAEAYTLKPSELALILYRIKSPELLALMARTETGNDRIRAVYPSAAHKSGTNGGALSDVGYVNDRVVAVMGRNAQPSDLASAAEKLSF